MVTRAEAHTGQLSSHDTALNWPGRDNTHKTHEQPTLDLTTLEPELARLRAGASRAVARRLVVGAALKAFELRGAAGAGAAPLPTQVLSALAAQKDDHAANVRAVEQAYARAIEQAPPAPPRGDGDAPAAGGDGGAAPGRPIFAAARRGGGPPRRERDRRRRRRARRRVGDGAGDARIGAVGA